MSLQVAVNRGDTFPIEVGEIEKMKADDLASDLATELERYDRILVLHRGRLEEQGNHHELMAGRRLYRELWEADHGWL